MRKLNKLIKLNYNLIKTKFLFISIEAGTGNNNNKSI